LNIDKLIRFARRYAVSICHGYCSDDILGVAGLGLAEALASYSPGNDFKVWVRVCVRREIVRYFRGELGRYSSAPEFQEYFDNDIRASCNGTEKAVIARDMVRKFVDSLPCVQKKRFLMRCNYDMTNEEIAGAEGVKETTIEQTFHSIYWRAKRFLSDNPVRCGDW